MFKPMRHRILVGFTLAGLPWCILGAIAWLAPETLRQASVSAWWGLAMGALLCLGLGCVVLLRLHQRDLEHTQALLSRSTPGQGPWAPPPHSLPQDMARALAPLEVWHEAQQASQAQLQAQQAELLQHQGRLDALRQVLERMHRDGHTLAQAVAELPAVWHEDATLQGVLHWLQTGHARLVQSVQSMTEVVERNSTTLAELSWQAKNISQAMNMLAASGTQAASGSQTLSENSLRVSQQATQVGALARQAEENSRHGQQELQTTIASMRTMGTHTQEVNTSIIRLQESSRKIENIAQLIRDIADKINLLSLNAAIEAARAGEHGRGFAVVAQEVNNLAEKTFHATQEIDTSIEGILGETDHAVQSINVLLSDVQNNVHHIDQVGQRLSGILEFSSVLTQQMDGIVGASEQSAREVQGISGYLGDIRNELLSFGQRIQTQENQIVGLTELGEGFFDNLIELRFETVHHRMYAVARRAADQVQQVLEAAIAQGQIRREDLLSGDYQPIPNTNPPQFHSRFDAFCDRVLPPVQEPVLKDNPHLIFAICTDKRGYVPTHNDKFAKAPTGDYATDLVHSRSKRIFNDRTGSRCGAHTKKMLLQTYKRDTGEIMHDLSVPIYVGGTHWGGFRMGYQAHEGAAT
jgi:methyl-accepting chemotaxis protein